MKCLVLISLVLSTFLLQINAQDNKTQLHQQEQNESEIKPESLKFNLIDESSSNNSFVQKIKKGGASDFTGFNIETFSSEQINEAFKSFGTRLKRNETNPSFNLIIDEEFDAKEDTKNESSVPPTEAPLAEIFEPTNITKELDLNETESTLNDTNSAIFSQNEKLDLSNPDTNTSTVQNESITTISPESTKEVPNQGYFEIVVPQSEVKNDSEMRSILENLRDSVNEGSYLGKEKIVRSDTLALFQPNDNERVDRVVEIGTNNSINKTKISGRKMNYGRRYTSSSRYSRNKKNSRKRSKSKKPVDLDESKTNHKNHTIVTPPHTKQDRRMTYEEYNPKFGTRHPDTRHDFPYEFEPIHQYAQAYPHGLNSDIASSKILFEPHQDQVSRSFDHDEHGLNHFDYKYGHRVSSQYFEKKNEYGPVTFGVDHSAPYEHNHETKTVTVTKEIPVPYTVKIEKQVPYPVYVKVPYDKPYPVIVRKPYKIVHEVLHPYDVHIKVPKPYEVIKHVPTPVKVPVDRPYPVSVPKPYHVTVEKKVPVTVEKRVPYPVPVPVDRPYPVHVPVTKHVPYTVEKRVPVEVKVPVDKPYPVYIPKPYAVHVAKPVPHTVEKHVPYPVKVAVKYPVKVPVPYQVVKHIPVYEHDHHYSHSNHNSQHY